MKIKEKGEQRIVIAPSLSDWLATLFLLVLATFFSAILPQPWGIVVGTVGALFALGMVAGNRVVIDRSTQAITMGKRPFLLIHRQRVIPFSNVGSVVIEYEPITSGGGQYSTTARDAWKVSIDIVGKKLKIDHTTNKANMFHLASDISSFIGTELVDNSAKPEFSFAGLFHKVKGFFRKGGS